MVCRIHIWRAELFTRLYIGVTTLHGSATDQRRCGAKPNRATVWFIQRLILCVLKSQNHWPLTAFKALLWRQMLGLMRKCRLHWTKKTKHLIIQLIIPCKLSRHTAFSSVMTKLIWAFFHKFLFKLNVVYACLILELLLSSYSFKTFIIRKTNRNFGKCCVDLLIRRWWRVRFVVSLIGLFPVFILCTLCLGIPCWRG